MTSIELIEVAEQFEREFGENIQIGWTIRDEHVPLLRRCIRENDPTPLHDMLDEQVADLDDNGITL